MKIVDAYILARTKRKTRRIRTALVTIVSSLLFAVLFFGSFVASGIGNSANQVKDVGFNSRYLVTASQTGLGGQVDYEALDKKIMADMDAELRAKDITVDESTRLDASYVAERSRRLGIELNKSSADSQAKFESSIRKSEKPAATYHLESLDMNDALTHHPVANKDPRVEQLVKQQENPGDPSREDVAQKGPTKNALEFFGVEGDMLRTQLLPGQSFAWKSGQPIPLVIPYPQLERFAGKSFTGVDTATKNQGYKELIAQYNGKVLNYCYRNITAQQQLQDVITYNHKVTQDKDKTTKPLALSVCGGFKQSTLKDLGIISDTSSEVEPLFKAPAEPVPQTKMVKFKIVGFIPGQDLYNTDIITSIFTGIGTIPFISNPGIVPASVVAKESIFKQPKMNDAFGQQTALFFDFASRQDQREFLAKGCQGDECINGGKSFRAPFGNINVALEGVYEWGLKFLITSIIIMMIIAALMIMLTISKVIADSSKEIAVFRALGARRRDIAHIYFTYGAMLAGSSLLMSLILAVSGAYGVNILFGKNFADSLIQAVGAYTQNPQVNLLGFDLFWTIAISGALLLAAFVGILLPVMTAIRRKLITILREE